MTARQARRARTLRSSRRPASRTPRTAARVTCLHAAPQLVSASAHAARQRPRQARRARARARLQSMRQAACSESTSGLLSSLWRSSWLAKSAPPCASEKAATRNRRPGAPESAAAPCARLSQRPCVRAARASARAARAQQRGAQACSRDAATRQMEAAMPPSTAAAAIRKPTWLRRPARSSLEGLLPSFLTRSRLRGGIWRSLAGKTRPGGAWCSRRACERGSGGGGCGEWPRHSSRVSGFRLAHVTVKARFVFVGCGAE